MAWLPKVKRYFENMGKTAKYIAVSEFNEAMPMFEATRESNEDLIRDTKKSFKQRRLFKEIYKQTGISEVFKSGSEMMRNAKSSLKSGEFYNKARAKKASDKTLSAIAGFDLSDFDNLDFGEEDESENDLNNQGDMFKSLESDLDSGFEANAEAVSSSVLTSAEYTAETIKGAASLSYSQSMKQIQTLRLGFDTLNKGIGSILKFNQDQLQKHIMNSTQFFESTSKLLTEQNAMVKEMLEMQRNLYKAARTKDVDRREDPLEEILNPYTGAINLKAYGKAIKGNLENNAWFMMGKMMWDMRHELIANPIEFLFRNTLMAIGGEKVKGKLEDLQKTVIGSLATLNARLLKTAKNDGGILGTIASIFGIEAPGMAKVDTGKFEKGPMQFNGAANKAITEVIPTYLARIEAALTGSPAKFYNMETGKWNTAKELKEKFNKEKEERELDDFKEVFKNILNNKAKVGSFSTDKQLEIQQAFASMYDQIVKNEGLVTKAKFSKTYDGASKKLTKITLDNIKEYREQMGLSDANISDDVVTMFAQIMEDNLMRNAKNQLALAVRNKKGSNADFVARIMGDPTSPYNLLLNGALRDTTDDVFTDTTLSNNLKHKSGNAESNLLNANRDIFIGMYNELFNIRQILLQSGGSYKKNKLGNRLNIAGNKLSLSDKPINFEEKINDQSDVSEYINNPSSDLFEEVDVDELLNADEVFNDLMKLVESTKNNNELKKKIKYEIDLCNNLKKIIDNNWDVLSQTPNKTLYNFYESVKEDPNGYSCKSSTWDPLSNPYFRNVANALRWHKESKNSPKKINDMNPVAFENAMREIENAGVDKTSKEKLDEYTGTGFLDKLKNAKGFDKLGVIKNQLGSFIDKPVNFVSNILDNINNAVFDVASGDFGFIKDAFNRLTGKAYGDKNLSRSGLYVLSKGEAVIPSHLNPWNPNRSNADPRKDAQSENNLLARLSQSGVPISGSFAEGTAVVNPGNNDNKSIIEKVRDTIVGAGNKLSMFIDSNTGNAITVTKEKAEDIVDKAQTKVEELQDKATSLTGKVFEYFKNTFSDTLGRGAGGALIGGLLTGGNPLGILLGGSVSILMGMAKKSNIITDTLFGNNFDKKGLSKYIPASIRKQAKNMKDYGIAGSIAGLGIGALGGPLGLVGGALLGSTVGYLKDNDEAKTLLFGPGLGENLKKLFKTKEKMKYTAVGGTIGGLLGGPLGVVGGALVGSGLSFVTTSEQFKEMMFGKKEGDKVVKEGLLQKMDRFFGDSFKENRKKFADYITEAITGPIERAMVPVGTALQVGVKNAVKGLEKALKNFVQADISSRWGRLGQSIRKNKWMSGAVGGALGGMMMGGPIGGILGGILGSAAHGTGADAKLFNFGKNISLLPGKGLDFISNKLTKWEINSGNGFNWTAQERLDKGGDDYKKTSYGKADTALSKMNKSELIMLQSLIKGIDNLDEATKYATEELMRAIDRVLAVSGLSITEQDNIKEILVKNKEKTKIVDINKIIENSDSIGLKRKKEVIKELEPRIETFISTMAYVESLKDRGVRDAAIKEAADKLGIDSNELQDKDKREKFTMYSAKEIANRDGDDKISIEAQDITAKTGDKIVDAVGSNVTRLMNFMRLMQKDYLKDDKVKVFFDAFGNATMYREVTTPDGKKDIQFIDNELNANSEEEKKKIKEAILGTAENTKKVADNTEPKKEEKKEEEKKETGSFLDALKGVANSITGPFKNLFGGIDAIISSIPILGDVYKYGKMKANNGIRYAGNKFKGWANKRIANIFGPRLNKIVSNSKFKDARTISDWLQGKYNDIGPLKIEGFTKIEPEKVYTGQTFKTVTGKKAINLSNDDRAFINKIKDANNKGIPIELSDKELDRINKITAQGKNLDRKTRELLNNAKKEHIENAKKIAQEKADKLTAEANKKIAERNAKRELKYRKDLVKGSFARNIDAWSLKNLRNINKNSINFDMMLRGKWYDRAMDLIGTNNKYAQKIGKYMLSENSKNAVTQVTRQLGKAYNVGARYGVKAAGATVKFLGKWGGKIVGAALDVIDSMAIATAMNEASDSVQIDEKQPEQALPIIAKSTASIAAAMPYIGDAIRRNNPNDALGDLFGAVAENGGTIAGAAKGVLSKVKGKGLKGTAKGILSAGKGLLKGKGLKGAAIAAAVAGVGYIGVKTGAISEQTAIETTETAANTSRVAAFVTTAFKAICKVAGKFMKPENAKNLARLGKRLLAKVTSPKFIGRIASKILRKSVQFLTGPLGWGFLLASAGKSFYDGFSDAEKYWQPKEGEEMTTTKKMICGLSSAIAEFCCLDLVMSQQEIVQFVKDALGFSPKELEAGSSSSLFGGENGMTIFNAKSLLAKLDDSVFNIKIFDKLNITDAYNSIKEMMSNLWDKITKKFTDIVDGVKDFAGKIADFFKNFSLSDIITGACKSAKDWINNLFNFDVKEKSKQLIQEDANQLEVHQLDEDDNELVEKYKASLNLNTGISFSSGKKSSSRGNIGNLKDIAMKQQMAKGKRKGPDGDGGYFGIGDGGTDNAQRIWDYLSAKGLGSSSIAGIMGNIQQESGFMPDRVQGPGVITAPEITVDGETGYGLCQWTYKARQQALKDFAASRGKPSSDLETQLDFMLQEVNQSDSGLIGKMDKMSPQAAAAAFHDSFERSADDAAGVAKRGNNAAEIFRKQGRGITTAGTYSAAAAQGSNGGSLSTSGSSSGGGIFDSIIKKLEGGALGKLGAALFGSASFFTSGLSGSLGGGTSGGAGSSRPFGGASPNIVNGKSGCANYKQDDTRWYNAPYSSSTVGRSGCMPTSFCNMASMYGVKLLPPDACTFSAEHNCYVPNAGTALKFYELAAEHWNVPVQQCSSWDEVMNSLRQGKPVAGGFEGGGGYSSGGHWMLLTHVDANGNIYIADSRNNYQGITGPDISGYHPESEVRAHWAGPGYAYAAINMPTVTSANGKVLDYLQDTLKGNITGKFGELRDGEAHGGVDIAAAEGTPILSPIPGVVSNIGIEPAGYGNYIQIKDDKGKYHLFGHLKETPKLELNDRIKTGQNIGLIGNTGHSTGPHLHYQIDPESNHRAMKAGQHIDPNTYTISQDTMNRIDANNSSVADFKRNEYYGEGDGDGGIGERFTKLADIATFNKENLEGLKPIDYEQKFDMIIQLLSSIVSLLGGGNKASNFNANINTNNIPATIAGGIGGGLTNTPKFATTAPGKSIESILANMISLAKGT